MLKIIALGSLLLLTACGVSSSDNVNVDANDLTYIKDSRTGLCYAVVASRKAMSVDTTGLGFTMVTCNEKVMALIKNG